MANSITLSQVTSTFNKLILAHTRTSKIVEQTSNGIMVGEFTIVPNETGYDLIKQGKWYLNFQNKVVAFEYAINYPRTKYKKTYLQDIDKSLSRHKADAAFHLINMKNCRKNCDREGANHYENLLSESRFKINQCIRSASKFSRFNF